MTKSELLNRLREECAQWETLLNRIGMARMEQPGVCGTWSMKDLVAHLTDWDRWLLARVQAAQHGDPDPAPPWTAKLQSDDEINAWIFEANHRRPVGEVLGEADRFFQQLLAMIEGLPAETRFEIVEPGYYLVWVGDKRLPVSDFFGHFRDEHEAGVRAWLARV